MKRPGGEHWAVGAWTADCGGVRARGQDAGFRLADFCVSRGRIEEASIYGGLGGAIAEIVAEEYPARVKRMRAQ